MCPSPAHLAVGGAVLGVLSHLFCFVRGEHHRNAPWLAAALVLSPYLTYMLLSRGLECRSASALVATASLLVSYLGALFSSMLLYRAFFHPLRGFSGPFGAKLSKLWNVFKIKDERKAYKLLDKLHEEYGDIVRTGPNELSICDPEAIDLIHGSKSKCNKSPWYAMNYPTTATGEMRDKIEHDKRRRETWDKAFSVQALASYEPRAVKYADKLVEQIASMPGKAINVVQWFNYYSFDVMGDVGYGRSFDTLETGTSHFVIDIIHDAIQMFALVSPVPWIANILSRLPDSLNPMGKMFAYSEDAVQQRKVTENPEKDIMTYLIQGEKFHEDLEQNRRLLTADSRVVIIAGSDTTAIALVHIFYELARNPEQVRKLRSELEEAGIVRGKEIDAFHTKLRNLRHLNGIINESMRLHPPVPSGTYKETPAEGLTFKGTFIPGHVTLRMPHYTIQRSPRSYQQPEEFLPERWYSRPELILPRGERAFFPFSTGSYGCVGKQLALMELRIVVAKMVLEFNVSFAKEKGDEGNGKALIEQSTDCFIISMRNLFLKFDRIGAS